MSRRFVAATREKLQEMMSRDLGSLKRCAIMIDGIHVDEHLVLVALGIDESADKHVLGLYEGATETTTVCAGLLSDLEARGLRTDRTMLVVIDGSKALAKAIRAKFGTRVLIQRCQVHKRRNVEDHPPEDMKRNAGRTISAASQRTVAPGLRGRVGAEIRARGVRKDEAIGPRSVTRTQRRTRRSTLRKAEREPRSGWRPSRPRSPRRSCERFAKLSVGR